MFMRTFLVLHGLENRRWPGHWQRHLVAALRAAGHPTIYPQLPNEATPAQDEWHDVVRTELELLHEAGAISVTVIAHSLSGVSILGLLENVASPIAIEHLLLVAPADPELIAQRTDFRLDVSSPTVRAGLQRSVERVTLIASEADEWLPRGVEETYAQPLELEPVLFHGAGHISMNDGFGLWQGVINWALAPESDERHQLLLQR